MALGTPTESTIRFFARHRSLPEDSPTLQAAYRSGAIERQSRQIKCGAHLRVHVRTPVLNGGAGEHLLALAANVPSSRAAKESGLTPGNLPLSLWPRGEKETNAERTLPSLNPRPHTFTIPKRKCVPTIATDAGIDEPQNP